MMLFLFSVIISFVFANDLQSATKNLDNYCFKDIQNCRATGRYIAGGGIGYCDGYASFDGFFIPDTKKKTVTPFLDLRGHVFNNAKWAANVGVGLRKIAGKRVYGCNVYYDERKMPMLNYNQVGIGLETLGKLCDVRINGYFPVGTKITDPYNVAFAGFTGNSMLLSQDFELAMRGFNAEAAFHFGKFKNFDFYFAGGPYYFAGTIGPKIWGGKVRLVSRFKEYWTLELSNSYDPLFLNRFQCQLSFSVPFGGKNSKRDSNILNTCDLDYVLKSRRAQPVVRQEIVVLENQSNCSVAINPETCQPYNFVFVNNTSNSDGTYQSPYPTFALAQQHSKIGDIIYVYPGNGTTQGMNSGLVLKSEQNLWGSGVDHTLVTTQGSFVIPAQTDTAPTVTNVDGNAITLADINQIKGINFNDVVGNAIFGDQISNVDISQCNFTNTESGDHIHLEATQGTVYVDVHDVSMTTAEVYTVYLDSSASYTQCVVRDSVFDRNVNGSSLNFAGAGHAVFSNNIMTNTSSVSSAPIVISAESYPVSASIVNNTITNNRCGAILFGLNDTNSASLLMRDNVLLNNQAGSRAALGSAIVVDASATNAGNCTIDCTGNKINNNEQSGLYCTNGSLNNFNVQFISNVLKNNTSGCTFNNPCNNFTLNAKNNLITNGRDNGIGIVGTPMQSAQVTLSDNVITDGTDQASAVAISVTCADLDLNIIGNNFSDNGNAGVLVYSSIENLNATITNNIINNNQNAGSNQTGGIDIEEYVHLSATIKNNTLQNNAGPGLYVGSSVTPATVCLTLKGNNSNTDYTLSNTAGTFNVAPCNVESVNAGTINTSGVITSVVSCDNQTPC